MNLLLVSAFQQGGHPAIVGLPQDGGRLAAVRPLPMPEPPPLISSTKQGGSITQVLYSVKKTRICISKDGDLNCFKNNVFFF